MAEQILALEKREVTGKKLTSLRAAGKVPSVVYGGKDFEPVLTASDYNATERAIEAVGYHSPVSLEIEGKKQLAMIKDIDLDPVSRRILNVGFRAISADEKVEATTPIVVVNFGESMASKAHLNLLVVMDEIEVRAKPSDLPKQIEVDGAHLETPGDRLTVADLVLPAGVELADKELEPTASVANVYDAAAEAEKEEAEAEEATEETPEAAETTEETK